MNNMLCKGVIVDIIFIALLISQEAILKFFIFFEQPDIYFSISNNIVDLEGVRVLI